MSNSHQRNIFTISLRISASPENLEIFVVLKKLSFRNVLNLLVILHASGAWPRADQVMTAVLTPLTTDTDHVLLKKWVILCIMHT